MNICFVADNRNRLNWGCRATSLALFELISKNNHITSVIHGDLTFNYDFTNYTGIPKKNTVKFHILKKIHKDSNFISLNTEKSLTNFLKIYKKYPPLDNINKKISECDAVVLNGEGSFIFSTPERYDTKFYLFILSLAKYYGKKCYVYNSMFSDGNNSKRNIKIINECKTVLAQCDKIVARDLLSFQYCKELICKNVEFLPDALFAWGGMESIKQQYTSCCKDFPLCGIPFPEWNEQIRSYTFSSDYICISGSSLAPAQIDKAKTFFSNLIKELKKEQKKIIVVSTCIGDSFLEKIALEENLPYIPVNTNIYFGYSILANAQLIVSGRWHPSIMASLAGVPCIFLESNSHKTLALPDMLEYKNKIEYSFDECNIKEICKEANYLISNNNEIKKKILIKSNDFANKLQNYYSNPIKL